MSDYRSGRENVPLFHDIDLSGVLDKARGAIEGRVLPPTPAPFDERRGAVNRIESMTGKVHSVQGFINITDIGETVVDIEFPVWFIEKPILSCAAELEPGQSLVAGAYPTYDIVVVAWRKQQYDGGVFYYSGGTFSLKVGGPRGQKLIINWQMEGKALRNPIGSVDQSVDGAI